jgi:hypothetical protein
MRVAAGRDEKAEHAELKADKCVWQRGTKKEQEGTKKRNMPSSRLTNACGKGGRKRTGRYEKAEHAELKADKCMWQIGTKKEQRGRNKPSSG